MSFVWFCFYLRVIQFPNAGVWVDVGSHKWSDHTHWRHSGCHVLGHFRLWRQAASSSLQAVCSHNWKNWWYQILLSVQHYRPNSKPIIWICTELTFLHHAHNKTLLVTAELASIPPPLVHRTVFVGEANILGILLYCTLWNKKKNYSKPVSNNHLTFKQSSLHGNRWIGCIDKSDPITLKNPLHPSQVRTP